MSAGRPRQRPRTWGKNLVILFSVSLNIYFLLTHPESPSVLRDLVPRIRGFLEEVRKAAPGVGKGKKGEESPPGGEIIIRRHEESKPPRPKVREERRGEAPAAVLRTSRAIVWVSARSGARLISGFTAERKRSDGIGMVVWRDSHAALILTAAHLLQNEAPEVSADPEGPPMPVDVVAKDEGADLALLRVSTRALSTGSALRLASSAAVTPATSCWFPATPEADEKIVFRSGVILGRPDDVYRQVEKKYGASRAGLDWYVLSESSFRGLSGAPVLSSSGRLTGVLIGGVKYPGGPERTLVMGLKALKSFLRRAAPRELGG